MFATIVVMESINNVKTKFEINLSPLDFVKWLRKMTMKHILIVFVIG